MRLKYQLRGLGIGIILAALLMGISSKASDSGLTDAQIKARAQELGMVENVLLTEIGTKQEPIQSQVQSETETETVERDSTEAEATEENTEEQELETQEPETVPDTTEVIEKMAVIIIKGGDGSDTVSRKLELAGLVSSAGIYDKYLCQHGYDKKIRTGTYEIPIGATEEEIAKIISGN